MMCSQHLLIDAVMKRFSKRNANCNKVSIFRDNIETTTSRRASILLNLPQGPLLHQNTIERIPKKHKKTPHEKSQGKDNRNSHSNTNRLRDSSTGTKTVKLTAFEKLENRNLFLKKMIIKKQLKMKKAHIKPLQITAINSAHYKMDSFHSPSVLDSFNTPNNYNNVQKTGNNSARQRVNTFSNLQSQFANEASNNNKQRMTLTLRSRDKTSNNNNFIDSARSNCKTDSFIRQSTLSSQTITPFHHQSSSKPYDTFHTQSSHQMNQLRRRSKMRLRVLMNDN